jgi:Uncharacterized conserved protein
MPIPRPDLSQRPHSLTLNRDMRALSEQIYDAFVLNIESWFAAPGTAAIWAEVGTAWFFETEHQGQRHPHYGRFLHLAPGYGLTTTWVTGPGGTDGVETVLNLQMERLDQGGTRLTLTHAGFASDEAMQRHAAAWPQILDRLDAVLTPLD